jgi:predicted ATPase
MISSITLENFKCFKEKTKFPFSKINLLTGINGRGKSTVLQSMLLMKQSVEEDRYASTIYLKGETINLGTFQDIENEHRKDEYMPDISLIFRNDIVLRYLIGENLNDKHTPVLSHFDLGLRFDAYQETMKFLYKWNNDTQKYDLYYYIGSKGKNIEQKNLIKIASNQSIERLLLDTKTLKELPKALTERPDFTATMCGIQEIHDQNFYENIHYIAADRIGPKVLYEPKEVRASGVITANGDNVASIISKKKEIGVFPVLIKNKAVKADLLHQISAWLTYIFDASIELQINDSLDEVILLYFMVNGVKCKPTNVGFGYSYVLPILVAGLTATNKHTLIIENPEAHLHPSAQARLVEFLAKVATCDVQIFIESHSEHILNALCIAVVSEETTLRNDDISVLYFKDTPEGEPNCIQIPILGNGNIEEWPDGFFDQTNKDYKILYGKIST